MAFKMFLRNTKNQRNRTGLFWGALFFAPNILFASPWLEANDPFLRSSLLLLADSHSISSPVSHYPIRWSLFGDDLGETRTSDASIQMAQRELLHTLSSAKLNRGNQSLRISAANNAVSAIGFGQGKRDEWGAYTSYEHLDNQFSFRLTAGYSDDGVDEDYRWHDSYLSLNAGNWLFSFGNLDRWWGQGWQHNLILGTAATSSTDISVSYVDENSLLGIWNVEAIWTQPKDETFDNHGALRLISKPLSWLEAGVTYQTWLYDEGERVSQTALDFRTTLPRLIIGSQNRMLYHSVYGEIAATLEDNQLGAYLLGWTGSINIREVTVRSVFEAQQRAGNHERDSWIVVPTSTSQMKMPAYLEQYNNSYLLENSWSAAMYFQTPIDHSFGLIFKDSSYYGESVTTSEVTYRLPVMKIAMAHIGLRYDAVTQNNDKHDETTLWTGLEFRF